MDQPTKAEAPIIDTIDTRETPNAPMRLFEIDYACGLCNRHHTSESYFTCTKGQPDLDSLYAGTMEILKDQAAMLDILRGHATVHHHDRGDLKRLIADALANNETRTFTVLEITMTGEDRFLCDECAQEFPSLAERWLHMGRHPRNGHRIAQYACQPEPMSRPRSPRRSHVMNARNNSAAEDHPISPALQGVLDRIEQTASLPPGSPVNKTLYHYTTGQSPRKPDLTGVWLQDRIHGAIFITEFESPGKASMSAAALTPRPAPGSPHHQGPRRTLRRPTEQRTGGPAMTTITRPKTERSSGAGYARCRGCPRCQDPDAPLCSGYHPESPGLHPVCKACRHCVLRGSHQDDAQDVREGQYAGQPDPRGRPSVN